MQTMIWINTKIESVVNGHNKQVRQKFWTNSIRNFFELFWKHTNKQTNADENITSFVEVISIAPYRFRQWHCFGIAHKNLAKVLNDVLAF